MFQTIVQKDGTIFTTLLIFTSSYFCEGGDFAGEYDLCTLYKNVH